MVACPGQQIGKILKLDGGPEAGWWLVLPTPTHSTLAKKFYICAPIHKFERLQKKIRV